MQSQAENYLAKAREFARLAAVTKWRRDARHHRKFADMYWALAPTTNRSASSIDKRLSCQLRPFVECATNAVSTDGAGNGAS